MALIKCKECGNDISDKAACCPHCGVPVEKEIYCSNCGEKVPATEQYCPKCGTKLNVPGTCSSPIENDKIVTALLAIILGGLGIHYFYLGKTKAGIITIILSLVTCGIWSFIMFIQGVLMLVMPDDRFRDKYINTTSDFPIF